VSPDLKSTRPLLDKLGVKPGAKIALVRMYDAGFERELRTRTQDISHGKPAAPCDLVFLHAQDRADLARIKQVKSWIEPSGGIWVIRRKGAGAELRDTDVIAAGLAAGLVDNKIASFSETEGAMRLVFRLKDRPSAATRR
jgi:hypothetical protein